MSNIEAAISKWCEEAAKHVPRSDLDELEAHLRDGIEDRVKAGLSEEEAFAVVTHRLGDAEIIGKELIRESGKLSPSVRPRRRQMPSALCVMIPILAVMVLWLVLEYVSAFLSQSYTSQVTFEVQPMQVGASFPMFEGREVKQVKPMDLPTEVEVVRGKRTLYEVVDSLRLDKGWEITRPLAYERLAQRLTVESLGDAQMVRVSYRGEDPQLSANVANGVAKAYQDRKRAITSHRLTNELVTLEMQLKAQTDRVEEARLRMLDLGERYRITPKDVDLANEAIRSSSEAVRAAELALARAQTPIEREKLEQEMVAVKRINEKYKDRMMDIQRKIAEWEEAKKEYELQTEMLASMQETFAKSQVLLTMPLVPIIIHEEAEVATDPDLVSWTALWSGVFTKGWPALVLAALGGLFWGWSNGRPDREPVSLERGEMSREDEISWA